MEDYIITNLNELDKKPKESITEKCADIFLKLAIKIWAKVNSDCVYTRIKFFTNDKNIVVKIKSRQNEI